MRILVTGGAGFIGSHLVDALIEMDHSVRVLDAIVPQVHDDGLPFYLDNRAELLQGDVADAETVNRALDNIDVVFHQAAEVGVGQSMYEVTRYMAANTMGTATLLQAMIKRPSQFHKLIVASSMSIYGEGAYSCATCGPVKPSLRPTQQLLKRRWEVECPNCGVAMSPVPTNENTPLGPTSVYAISKQDQEQLCLLLGRAYDIPTVALRYFNVYGTRQALSNPYTGVCAIFCSRLLNGQRPVIFEDGCQTRDLVHVSDIVQANLLALKSDTANFNAINVGTGRSTSVRQVAELLASGLGKMVQVEIVGKYREGDIRHCVADITSARVLLDYEPKVTLDKGIPALLNWVNGRRAKDRLADASDALTKMRLVR